MDVVCTAGHVDHGKSTLVRALTGMEPDRFDEERRRGLTIDIGFGWTDMTDGATTRTVAFVDLPGHERFIANMLAGAGPAETALLVVAADEGWMPQSQEHLDILDLLGVRAGIVAVSKSDAADAEQIRQTSEDVSRRLSGTSLAGAAVVAVSAATGAGLDELRRALLAMLAGRPSPDGGGPPRLWVDRSFSVKGAGTVVTGTLSEGALQVGQEVTVLPAGNRARVRGLQSLKADVAAAPAGDRVAVNLAGIDRAAVTRGDVVAGMPAARPTTTVQVWCRTAGEGRVSRRGAWHLHAGSGQWPVSVRPLLQPVDIEGFATLLLDAAAPLAIGDRFVLRDSGRRATVAGGLVLDTDPPASRGTEQRAARVEQLRRRLQAVQAGDRDALLSLRVAERGIITASELALPPGTAAEVAASAGLVLLGDALADPAAIEAWAAAALQALADHHRAHPDERSAPRELTARAAAAAGCPPGIWPLLVEMLLTAGRVRADGAGLRLPDHGVTLSPAQRQARADLLAALDEQPFSPPRLSDAAAGAGVGAALLRELEKEGDIVRLTADLAITPRALGIAADVLRNLHAEAGPFTAAAAKQALGTSRKYAVPLLEELDRRAITRRSGDVRDVVTETPRPQDR